MNEAALHAAWFQHSIEGVLAFDRECRYTVWNPVMERITGYAAARVLGRCAHDLFPFLREKGEDRHFQEALSGRSVVSEDCHYTIPETGLEGYYEARYFPLRDESGAVTGVLGLVREITLERGVARQRETVLSTQRQLQEAIDAVPALIALIGPDQRYHLMNRTYEAWFGMNREQYLGRPVREFVGEEAWSVIAPHIERALSGEPSGYEQQLSVGGRAPRWFNTTFTPRRNARGEVDGLVVLAYDVSAQKQAEECQRVLAEASKVLGSSLDLETTLRQVARLALPHLADLCLVDLVRDGEIHRIATARVHPEGEEALRQLQERFPPTAGSPAPAARVLRTGKTDFIPEVDLDVIASYTRDAEHARLIRSLGILSHIAAPLVARGEMLGVINLGLTGDRRYTPEDVSLVEELARRAAVAVDNARLFGAAQAEIEERRRVEEAVKLHFRVLESMREGVSVSNEEGVILYTNPAEDAMFGYDPGELVGRHVTVQNAYPPEENHRIVGEVIETLKRDGVWAGEWQNRKKDGTPFITRARITALELSGRQCWVCVQEDVTARKQAEEARRRSEAFAQQIIDSSLDCIKTLDLEARLLSISVNGLRLLEIPELSEVLGVCWIDFWKEDREEAREAVEAAKAGGVGQFVGFCPTVGGSPKWWDVVVSPIWNADGEVERLLAISRDITRIRRDETEVREQARIIETVDRVGRLLAAELDLQKLLQALTDAATEITTAQFGSFFYNVQKEEGESYMLYTLSGAPREAFENFPLPRNTAIFAPTFDGERVVRLEDVTQDAAFGKNPPYNGMPEGHLPVRSYLAVPVQSRTGEVLGGLFFGHSEAGVFTERHERVLVGIAAQAAIAIDNARLYKVARDAEYAARERAEQLGEANRQKDAFLAMLAHELRNPLGAISNAIHVMSRTTPSAPPFTRAQEVAVRQITHQTRLVDDLLDVSRIARGKIGLQMEALDLAELARETAADHRSAIERAGIALRLELPSEAVWIRGDRVRLAQVVGNLLDNARKFTPAGGLITLRVSPHDMGVTLSVRDTGSGIEADVLPHLFTPFSQADRTLDRSQGGLGLGLALVKGLVELHEGGRVGVASAGPGQGAEFQIRLPTVGRVAPVAGGEERSTGGTGVRVLVIEDIRDAAETMRDLLELLGCEVRVAYSGAEGLVAAPEFRPDVVLCDIGLPGGLTGYDVARRLRADPVTASCRLIALTGYGADEDKRRSVQAGFDFHLTKPVQPEPLRRALLGECFDAGRM